MSPPTRGQWIVRVHDVSAAKIDTLGPFTSPERALRLAHRLTQDVATAAPTVPFSITVDHVRPGVEAEDFRDELLASLEAES